ncbi:hypothetical protein Fmac_018697 [Flemingia macrophylla]|uniref:Uncharacterized protein n=1 Tax=Flemingia macrophylla TaxID=520843 RepID=A0ABD1M5S2_9FABA
MEGNGTLNGRGRKNEISRIILSTGSKLEENKKGSRDFSSIFFSCLSKIFSQTM